MAIDPEKAPELLAARHAAVGTPCVVRNPGPTAPNARPDMPAKQGTIDSDLFGLKGPTETEGGREITEIYLSAAHIAISAESRIAWGVSVAGIGPNTDWWEVVSFQLFHTPAGKPLAYILKVAADD